MKELTIERINKQQALNIINSVSHYHRESTYWHDYLGVDFEKPFYAGVFSGCFTINQLVKALPQLKESYAIIGVVRKNRVYETVRFIGVDHTKPELLPCQVQHIYKKSLFEEIRKSSDCEAVVIIPDKVEWTTPKWIGPMYEKGNRYKKPKNSYFHQFDKSGYYLNAYKDSLKNRLKSYHRANEMDAFKSLDKEADITAAKALKESLINDVKNSAITLCTKGDVDRMSKRLQQLSWLLGYIDSFLELPNFSQATTNMYQFRKNTIDEEFLRYTLYVENTFTE